MEETELLYQAGLSAEWVHEFVTESNKIDPQPGLSEPGELVYDGHREAVMYAIKMASESRFALPHSVHRLLLRDHLLAGKLRRREKKIGLNHLLPVADVPYFMWEWNRSVQRVVNMLRLQKNTELEQRVFEVWELHCKFENIHPYDLYNGKVGRVLTINHSLLVGVEPCIILCKGREQYFDLIRDHSSAALAAS